MKNKSETQSFRRKKLIEEMAPQRKADALVSTQNAELGNITDQLKDAQAASEMTAEVVEQKGNQIISSLAGIDKKVQDAVAGAELTSEAVERVAQNTQATTGAVRAMSAKVSSLSSLLAEKLTGISKTPSTQESTTLQALTDAMPIQVEQPNLTELLEKLIPQHPIPEDAPFLPPPAPSNDEEKKKKDGKTSDDLGSSLEDLLKTTKGGFKAVVNVTDRIASMLFKYTVSALANAAKFAAQMFALVLGIDMIRVYFQYFMKQFEAGWDQFNKKFEEWGPLLEGLMTFAKNVGTMFSEKNWFGLAEAIVKGMVKLTLNMADILMLGMGKLTAYLLRSLGMDSAADKVEGGALMTYQSNSGATLSEEDQTKLAKYQDKKDQEAFEAKKKPVATYKDTRTYGQNYGYTGPVKDAKEFKEELSEDEKFRKLPEAERLEVFKKRNQAQADIKRLTETANDIMKPDETDRKNAKESYDNIKKQLADPSVMAASKDLNIDELMAKLDKSLEKFKEEPIKPQPVQEREETQQAVRVDEQIKAREAAKAGARAPDGGQVFQQVNVQKTNKTQYNMPPQSSTPAPGMHGATRVN